ncbi:MAG: hypothetical protein AB1500_09545 [Bacillota bacterium]
MERFKIIVNSQTLASVIGTQGRDTFDLLDILINGDASFLEQARRLQPDVIVYRVKEFSRTAVLVERLKRACPSTTIVAYALSEHPEDVADAINAGADSFILGENLSSAQVLQVLKLICRDRVCFFPESAAGFLAPRVLQ